MDASTQVQTIIIIQGHLIWYNSQYLQSYFCFNNSIAWILWTSQVCVIPDPGLQHDLKIIQRASELTFDWVDCRSHMVFLRHLSPHLM